MKTRTDARGIVTNYSYDALNRLITKTYPNDPANTPTLSYGYDQEYPFQLSNNENNPIGHPNSIQEALGATNLVAWTSDDYDQRGNLLGYVNCLWANTQSTCPDGPGTYMGYAYNLDGTMNSMGGGAYSASQNPGEDIYYGYDSAGHLNSIASIMGPNASALLTSTFLSGPTFYSGCIKNCESRHRSDDSDSRGSHFPEPLTIGAESQGRLISTANSSPRTIIPSPTMTMAT